MRNSIKKFILRTLLATLPVMLFIAIYAWRDPFHVVHPVGKDVTGRDSIMEGNNAGVTSVETYLLHNKEAHFNSFIFGSSMSQNYKASDWKSHLDSTASILHFDASSETLMGIINKMRFLNEHGTTIKNALIVIEAVMLDKKLKDNDILYVQHPAASGEMQNWFHFHTLFFNAFRYLGPRTIIDKNIDVIDEEKVDGHPIKRLEPINEKYYEYIDSLIAYNPDKFFTPERLAARNHVIKPQASGYAIDTEVEQRLRVIKAILDKNHTNYIIIVPPCNAKPQLQEHDLWAMKAIFGEDKVHDFSAMQGYPFNERMYYDTNGHLISSQCKVLLDSAYRVKPQALSNPFYKLPK